MKNDNQEEEVGAVKKTIVAPNHIAEVGIFFRITSVYCFDQ
jgi:hypothetical protein